MTRFNGFSKRNRKERINLLKKIGALDEAMIDTLYAQSDDMVELAENFSENVLGLFELPYSIAVNLVVNNKLVIVPMVVEETSIVASASKTAKWISDNGCIETTSQENQTIGQIYFSAVTDLEAFSKHIESSKDKLIDDVNKSVAKSMFSRGGGLKDLEVRVLEENNSCSRVVVHAVLATCDAMGANIVNQVCEYLKTPLESITGEKVLMCILSNLSEINTTNVVVKINNIKPELGKAIEEASYFSQIDSYRAATNNKGITNAIDAIAIATGNDWRAIEASLHAYAARTGRYQSLSQWKYRDGVLVGKMNAPIPVGVVGGVTSLHPMAKMSLEILGVKTANELAEIMGAVGLVQNLGAIKALVTKGIVNGHMRLHIDNILLSLKASNDEKAFVKGQLQDLLNKHQKVSTSQAKLLLNKFRSR